MIRRAVLGLASLLALLGSGAAAKDTPSPHLYGPPPSWAEYRRLAEAAVAEKLLDPESARFTWLSGIARAELRPEIFQPKVAGYWACGRVNAKNRMGGYSGGGAFMVAVDYGRALATSLDTSAIQSSGPVDIACQSLISKGILPPVPPDVPANGDAGPGSSPASATAASPTTTATGLKLFAMPEGAYVAAVTPGSPAAAAELKPGMVIASVNAIPLAGMGDAMAKVVDAAGSKATLTIIGGTTVKLGGGK